MATTDSFRNQSDGNIVLHEAVAQYGAKAKEKLSNIAASGEPEDQLRAPFEHLLHEISVMCSLGGKVTAVGESSVALEVGKAAGKRKVDPNQSELFSDGAVPAPKGHE